MAPALSIDELHPFPPSTRDHFSQLVANLSKTLGPSSGLDSADVDMPALTKLMEDYKTNDQEWRKYAHGDHSRGYTRNLVDEGNGKSNLVSHSHVQVSEIVPGSADLFATACPRLVARKVVAHT